MPGKYLDPAVRINFCPFFRRYRQRIDLRVNCLVIYLKIIDISAVIFIDSAGMSPVCFANLRNPAVFSNNILQRVITSYLILLLAIYI